MSEAVATELIRNLPAILGGAAAVVAALKSTQALRATRATKDEVNGALAKFLQFMEAANRAETKAARGEALAEAALQTATAPPAVVPITPRAGRSTDRPPEPPKE